MLNFYTRLSQDVGSFWFMDGNDKLRFVSELDGVAAKANYLAIYFQIGMNFFEFAELLKID